MHYFLKDMKVRPINKGFELISYHFHSDALLILLASLFICYSNSVVVTQGNDIHIPFPNILQSRFVSPACLLGVITLSLIQPFFAIL